MVAGRSPIEDPAFPPLASSGEPPAPNDETFVSQCLAMLDQVRGLGDIHPGASTLTVNKDWGVVFRADFTINKKPEPGFINRLICWRQPNGQIGVTYAIGQDITPLSRR